MNFAAWADAGVEEAAGGMAHNPINDRFFLRWETVNGY